MLVYLLAIILQINNIDYDINLTTLENAQAEKIVDYFHDHTYESAYQINRYLPPIAKTDFLYPNRKITAESYVVIDIRSGGSLMEQNAEKVMPIASLTKLMTALVFLDTNTDYDTEVTIEISDHNNVPGNHTYVRVGEKMTVRDLFYTSLVGSDNDATKALARSTGLSEQDFVAKMNEKAKWLGLEKTTFEEVTGLSPNNKSTVSEYAKIAKLAFRNLTILEALNRDEYDLNTINNYYHHIVNTNKLLSEENLFLVGAKTGYIDEAGFTFACMSEQDGNQVLVVVFNSNSGQDRFDDSKFLIEWAYRKYQWF